TPFDELLPPPTPFGELLVEVVPLLDELLVEVVPLLDELLVEVVPLLDELLVEVVPLLDELLVEVVPLLDELLLLVTQFPAPQHWSPVPPHGDPAGRTRNLHIPDTGSHVPG